MGPGLVEAKVETLSHGRVMRNINDRIDEALMDIYARPNVEKKRTVKLTIDVVPVRDKETGRLIPQFKANVSVTTPRMVLTDEALVRESDNQAMVSSAVQQELLQEPERPANVTMINDNKGEARA
jgi:hypothetical protein